MTSADFPFRLDDATQPSGGVGSTACLWTFFWKANSVSFRGAEPLSAARTAAPSWPQGHRTSGQGKAGHGVRPARTSLTVAGPHVTRLDRTCPLVLLFALFFLLLQFPLSSPLPFPLSRLLCLIPFVLTPTHSLFLDFCFPSSSVRLPSVHFFFFFSNNQLSRYSLPAYAWTSARVCSCVKMDNFMGICSSLAESMKIELRQILFVVPWP